MSWWRLRDPGSFPPMFHDVLHAGLGTDKLITRCWSDHQLKALRKEWRLFMYCLRQYPAHPTSKAAEPYQHRTRARFSHEHRQWEFLLTTRETVLQELVRMY